MTKKYSRRDFIKNASLAGVAIPVGLSSLSAASYNRIPGANDRVNFAVIGIRSRGSNHIDSLLNCENADVTHLCDVDKRYFSKQSEKVKKKTGKIPVEEKDVRILLESKDIDAISIASPEHWHAPMAIMGLQAGKHVYVEKPPSHNPAEGVMLVEAQKKYGLHVQMGNQQRSSVHTRELIKKIHDGIIGTPYMGKAWYSNNRSSIGVGKEVAVPDYLDWDLWQGPAPRRPYKDNVHPYNWHWFWHWGTGETLNNGTHEVDLCRWALGVDMPLRITASGGRYHYQDDWEFYDTLVTNFEYDDKLITWEGKSCNPRKYYNRGRGAAIHGTKGTIIMDRDGHEIYNQADELIYSQFNRTDDSMGLGGGGSMTDAHFQNFINAITRGEPLHAPISEGNIAATMLQLSNIAWKTNRVLNLDQKSGQILKDEEAIKLWSREYEKGWEPKV
jgi:predicted dehydrogenase